LLGRKKSERISKEQLALFLAKLTEEQAKLAETPETEVPAEIPAAGPVVASVVAVPPQSGALITFPSEVAQYA